MCVILAAGVGKRFGGDKAKTLLPLIGENILQRLLRQLRANKINDITVAISAQKEIEFIQNGPKLVYYKVVLNRGFECLSTLMQVKEYLSYPLLIIHSDIIMANDTMKEILSESYDDMMFVGNVKDIFCVLINNERHIRNFRFPYRCVDNYGSSVVVTKYIGKLWHMYWRYQRKFFTSKNFICDVDTPKDYKWAKKYMAEHKV